MSNRHLRLILFLLLGTALASGLWTPSVRAQEPLSTTAVQQVVVDQVSGRLIVVWSKSDQQATQKFLSIAGTEDGNILRTFSLPSPTLRIAVHPGTDNAYFVTDKQIYYLDLTTGQTTNVGNIPPRTGIPVDLNLNPVTSKVYVAMLGAPSDKLTLVVGEGTRAVIGTLAYLVSAVNPLLNRVYGFAHDPKSNTRQLFALDGATDSPLTGGLTLEPSGGVIGSVAVNTSTSRVYVIGLHSTYVIDGISNQVVSQRSALLNSIGAVNEKEDKIYGATYGPPGVPPMSIVDGDTLQEVGYWRQDGTVAGADSTRNLLVIIPRQVDTDALVLLLADGHNNTIQRRVVISPATSVPAAVQPVQPFANSADRVFFPQTGHSLSFGFKFYWEHNGGLSTFGYPITEELSEQNAPPPIGDGKTYTVQYFERARLEYHPKFKGTPFEVELGLLGNQMAATRAPVPNAGTDSQHAYFPATGQYLSYGFKYYWDHNGGLPIFGLPITGEFSEVNPIDGKTYTVQYFERARFEYHPEFAGTPFEVELGLLGDQVLQARGWR